MKKTKMPKLIGIVLAALTAAFSFSAFFGCNQGEQAVTPDGDPYIRQPWEITDSAKGYLADKINAADYVVDAKAGSEDFLKTVVCSEDLVLFDYYEDALYSDFAIVTVNGNETFQTFFSENGLRNTQFWKNGKAVDLVKGTSKILNSLNPYGQVTKEDFDELFYNYPEDPLKLSSREEAVIEIMCQLCNVTGFARTNVREVILTLDAENPSEAVMTADVNGTEVKATITFGNAVSDPRVDGWVNDPDREYPAAQDGWLETEDGEQIDRDIINSVFLLAGNERCVDEETDLIPFPEFASYAFTVNRDTFYVTESVELFDCRATVRDMQNYAWTLLRKGYVAVAEEDGDIYYRKLLRTHRGIDCYISVFLEYDGGVGVYAEKYYTESSYDDLDVINGRITAEANLPALPESDNFVAVHADDITFSFTESVLGISDYDLTLYIDLRYEDEEEASEYIENYLKLCGFPEAHIEGDGAFFSSLTKSNGNVITEEVSVKYGFFNSTLTVIIKHVTCIGAEELNGLLSVYGFPSVSAIFGEYPSDCRRNALYQKYANNLVHEDNLEVSVQFDGASACEEFLENYIGSMRLGEEDTEWERLPAATARIDTSYEAGYYNAEKGILFCFRFLGDSDSTLKMRFTKVSDQSKPRI